MAGLTEVGVAMVVLRLTQAGSLGELRRIWEEDISPNYKRDGHVQRVKEIMKGVLG